MTASLSTYLPSLLLQYLDEGPEFPYDEYEYQVLFGYVRWACYHAEKLHKESRLIPRDKAAMRVRGSSYIDNCYTREVIDRFGIDGIDSLHHVYLAAYGGRQPPGGYLPPTVNHLVRQLIAYLVSCDIQFQWEVVDKRLRNDKTEKTSGISAMRVAASLGNMPLFRRFWGGWVGKVPAVLGVVLVASVDKSFFDKILKLYPNIDTAALSYGAGEDLILRDDPERLSWFMPGISGGYRHYFATEGGEKIRAYLAKEGRNKTIG